MAPLVAAGLSLIPKIPEIWSSVASLFGKETPEVVKDAAKLRDDIMNDISMGKVSPEQMTKLKELMYEHKERMAEIALEERELDYKEKKLDYDDMEGVRDLEIEAYKSDDQFVKRTRPMILRRLFTICAAYVFFAPLCLVAMSVGGVQAALVTSIIGMVEWIGGWLFGTFSTAYLGYAAARTVDKRHPELKEKGNMLGKTLNKALKNL
jgi:hypothetical protein